MKVKALIEVKVFGNSRYNRNGMYYAIIEPEFFKNGKMKKTGFKEVERLSVIKDWYDKFAAHTSYSIVEVLEEVD